MNIIYNLSIQNILNLLSFAKLADKWCGKGSSSICVHLNHMLVHCVYTGNSQHLAPDIETALWHPWLCTLAVGDK